MKLKTSAFILLLASNLYAQDVTIPQSAQAIVAENSKMKAALRSLPVVNAPLTITGSPTVTSASPDITLTWALSARIALTNTVVWVSLPVETTFGAIMPNGMVGFPQGNLIANDARTVSIVLHIAPGLQANMTSVNVTVTSDNTAPITTVTKVTTTMTDAQLISGAVKDLQSTSAAVVAALGK